MTIVLPHTPIEIFLLPPAFRIPHSTSWDQKLFLIPFDLQLGEITF